MAMMDVLRDVAAWKQGLRTGLAGAATYLLAEWLSLSQGYWSVITAVLIIQQTVGATLQAVRDRLIGTFAGAVVGFLVAMVTPSGTWGTLVALVASTGALALCATRHASLRIAPMTAAIMLVAAPSHADVVVSASQRVIEILLGCVVGIVTQLLVFPRRAETVLRTEIADVLPLLAEYVVADDVADGELHRQLDKALARVGGFADQARAEHFVIRPGAVIDPGGITGSLRQLHSAAYGLRRIAHRASIDGNTALAARVPVVIRALHTDLLDTAAAVTAGESASPGSRGTGAPSPPPAGAPPPRGVSNVGGLGDDMAMTYADAYEQARLALDQLRSAVDRRVEPR